MTDTRYRNAIRTISVKEFGQEPSSIEWMTQGICNAIYAVTVGDREYIFRLNQEPRFMLGSREHIPQFRSLGIRVPEILAEDYSMSDVGFAFQIQKRIPGRDLGDVIASLSDDELRAVADEAANVFRRLATIPNNGKFGVVFTDGRDLVPSWSAEVARVTQVVRGWGRQTGVLNDRLSQILNELNRDYKSYFERIKPYTYFGDIAGKNVMVHEGKFAGLVDLDGLSQGDPLEAVGRIKSSWYGTHHGEIYTNAVMEALGLPEPQRKLVTMYALLNKVFWTLENGIQFNQNTSRVIDRERERRDKATVEALYAELKGDGAIQRETDLPTVELPVEKMAALQDQAALTVAESASEPDYSLIAAVLLEEFEPAMEETVEEALSPANAREVSVVLSESQNSDLKSEVDIEPRRGPELTGTRAEVVEPEVHVFEVDPPEPTSDRPPTELHATSSETASNFIREDIEETGPESQISNLESAIDPNNLVESRLSPRADEPHAVIAESIPSPIDHRISNPEPARLQTPPRTDGRAVLEASGLSKTYESDGVAFNALRNVDLRIARGDCLAIVGKSGSGKSTLMHLLACLDGPSDGYVYVDGSDTTTMSEAEKNQLRNEQFGFVFQQFFLNGRDTVFENVALPMRIRGSSDGDIAIAAYEALTAVGLADKAEKQAKDLSGGEKQRICIARALIGSPRVIFADEPTGNLDSNTGEAIERLLFDLNRTKGITLIVVTHDSDLANRFERIVEMKDGRIVSEYRGTATAGNGGPAASAGA